MIANSHIVSESATVNSMAHVHARADSQKNNARTWLSTIIPKHLDQMTEQHIFHTTLG